LPIRTHPSRSFYIGLLALALIFYVLFIARTGFKIGEEVYFTLVDDAMISMRYARNLAAGHGIVWNAGESPIQGYTNLGWMLTMALLHLWGLPASKISLAVMATSALLLLLNILAVRRIAEHLSPDSWIAPALSATLVAFYFPLVYWSLRGLEVGILSLLVNLATLLTLRMTNGFTWKSTLLFSLLAIAALCIRLDATPQLFILTAVIGVYGVSRKKRLHVVCIVLALAVVFLSLYVFQTAYFGEFLPNTYYLKVTGLPFPERLQRGWEVFARVALGDLGFSMAVVAGGLLLYKDTATPKTLLLLALFAVQCAYSIYVGGDSSEYDVGGANRFITQGVPFLFVMFGIMVDRLLRDLQSLKPSVVRQLDRTSLPLFLFLSLAALFIISGQQWLVWGLQNAPVLESDILRVKVGVLIQQSTDESTTVAVHAAGQISYFSKRKAIDLLGKNDAVIAKGPRVWGSQPGHNKWNYEYSILQLQPDVVADEWLFSRDFMAAHTDEYERLPNGIWIKKASTLVDRDSLSQDYR
jgi:hypothetical protein